MIWKIVHGATAVVNGMLIIGVIGELNPTGDIAHPAHPAGTAPAAFVLFMVAFLALNFASAIRAVLTDDAA
jgi:hypothetical protein